MDTASQLQEQQDLPPRPTPQTLALAAKSQAARDFSDMDRTFAQMAQLPQNAQITALEDLYHELASALQKVRQ